MANESTSATRKWPIAVAVIVCIPGWLAWMDLLQFTQTSAGAAGGVPLLHFAQLPGWEYLLIVCGPLVAAGLIAWSMSYPPVSALGLVVGLYAAALCIAAFLTFVDKAPDWMVVVLLAAAFVFLGIVTAVSSEERRQAKRETTRTPEIGPLVADELGKLGALRESGILSEEEFAAQKAKLLQ